MKNERDELVARVKEEILREVNVQSAGRFKVTDLAEHLGNLGRGADAAWKITYDTSSNVIQDGRIAAGALEAWKITYDTSSAVITPGNEVKR